jgi:hypothetical protein
VRVPYECIAGAAVIIGKGGVHLDWLVRCFRQILSRMPPEARVELFDDIEAGYCRACGGDTPPGFRCQCENDE